MVRDINTSAVEYLEFAMHQLPRENNVGIANNILEICGAALYSYVPNG